MILLNKKILFVHIPRTGGTIIEKSISNNFQESYLKEKHFESYDYKWAHQEYWDTCFKFGFVRNPYDWIVSFSHRYQINVETFVSYLERNPMIYAHCHNGPRWGQKLPFSNILDGVDFVGKFENLKEDYKYLQNKFDLPPLLEEKVKVTENRKKDFKWYYDEQLFDRVTKIFKKDLKKYEYKF